MIEAVTNTSVHCSTVVFVVAMMFIWLSFQTPTLLLRAPRVESRFVNVNDWVIFRNEVTQQDGKFNTHGMNLVVICDGFTIDS